MFEGRLTVTLADVLTMDTPVEVGLFPIDHERTPCLGRSRFDIFAVDDPNFRSWARLYLPGARFVEHVARDNERFALTVRALGASATVEICESNYLHVSQAETPRLWDTVEKAWRDWREWGKPSPREVNVTVACGRRWAWMGPSMEAGIRWPLEAQAEFACVG